MAGDYWDEQEAMIGEELARREKKESKMSTTEINWGYNCLTNGIHHGRPETIWNLPLGYATSIFQSHGLKSLVIARIYNDAVQIVDHNDNFDNAWAIRVREIAEERYDNALQLKVGELSNYYNSKEWELEQHETAMRVIEGKLNPGYEPLHPHDSINLLCRIIGTSASIQASKDVG